MVGSLSSSRVVSASTFIGAPRLHSGLADDEFATILQRGEVVLNKNNVAELKSGSGSGGGTVIVNVSAVDAVGVAKFFKNNRKLIARAVRATDGENNIARRRRE